MFGRSPLCPAFCSRSRPWHPLSPHDGHRKSIRWSLYVTSDRRMHEAFSQAVDGVSRLTAREERTADPVAISLMCHSHLPAKFRQLGDHETQGVNPTYR